MDSECPPILSVYADDVNIFLASEEDFMGLRGTLSPSEKVTCARMNLGQSEAVLLGQ